MKRKKTMVKHKSEERLYSFYKQMFIIRLVEQSILQLFSKGLLSGTVHTCIGQESCAVGVINALNIGRDVVFSTHRAHGHYIAYFKDIKWLLSEIIGRKDGICGGRGGSQQLYRKNFYTSGIQGNLVSVATGTALAKKINKTKDIVVIFLGDGTFGEGIVYEAFNIASLWSLPVLFVVENNKYAQTTPINKHLAGNIYSRAESFGISSKVINDNVEEVFSSSKKIVKRIRDSASPGILYINTYRLAPHSKGDEIRPKDELAKYIKNDPLFRLRLKLESNRINGIEEDARQEFRQILLKLGLDNQLDFSLLERLQ